MRSSATLSRATHLDTRRRARHRRRACNTLAQVSRRRVRHSCRATVSTLECARLRDWVDKLSRTASRTALRRTRALRSGATLRARHSGHRARRAAHSASRTARDTRTQLHALRTCTSYESTTVRRAELGGDGADLERLCAVCFVERQQRGEPRHRSALRVPQHPTRRTALAYPAPDGWVDLQKPPPSTEDKPPPQAAKL
jgi:hypothetical protein